MILPSIVALSAVATLGYVVGRRRPQPGQLSADQARRDLKRVRTVIADLEDISGRIRTILANHQPRIAQFAKSRVDELAGETREVAWNDLVDEAEGMLVPTTELAAQISFAYEELRHQSHRLMACTEARTDALTGVGNRKALDELLDSSFALLRRYGNPFSIVLFDVDHFKAINDRHGHPHGDQVLQSIARLLDVHTRETDSVARYGGEEFIVVMPHTELEGAARVAEKLRAAVAESGLATISGGTTRALPGDDPATLLARADAALYAAKRAGRNCIHRDDAEGSLSFARPDPTAEARGVSDAVAIPG